MRNSEGTTYFNPCQFYIPLYRNVYERGNRELKNAEDKEERLMLLESWKQFEVNALFYLQRLFVWSWPDSNLSPLSVYLILAQQNLAACSDVVYGVY